MNVLVVGGDGFCGWPTSLELLSRGHKVVIIDNFMRREIDKELGANSITNIQPLEIRIEKAKELINNDLHFVQMDVTREYDKLVDTINTYSIDTIIHFAEIKSAPYSMIDASHMRHTVDHNINATTNILTAIVHTNRDIHLVHLGTMGVYGYKDEFGPIPEGYLDITIKETNHDTSILWPTDPGSVYHATKSLDQILFQFYNKNWKLYITDLHQGIVWGAQTALTKRHTDLVNRFDYDGIYGTVLNRFVVESAVNHPLTVHGTGGQKRGFIHIEDTAGCIRRAVENHPEDASRVRIFNQASEVRQVNELAEMIKEKTGVEINYIENPRKERAENNLIIKNEGLQGLGFEPILLQDQLLEDIMFIAQEYKENINSGVIDSTWAKW